MYINSLELKNFRNYSHEKIDFSCETNIIFGKNAQGKTNLIEAIYLFSAGQSHRTSNDRDLIKFGEERGDIEIDFFAAERGNRCKITLFHDKRKQIVKDGVIIKSAAELVGIFKTVLFSPDELEIVKSGPEQRRRFIDRAIMPLRPNYINILRTYNKILRQKNMLLKSAREDKKLLETLPVWNEKMAEYGARIMWYRDSFIKKIALGAKAVNDEITSGRESLNVVYSPDIRAEDRSAFQKIKESMLQKISELAQKEREIGIALAGPHRDDVLFLTDGRPTRQYGSQGQQRTAVLSVKMAQMELIKSEIDEYPVLLLDDIMSELDETRREYLRSRIRGKQVILTCTDSETGEKGARQFEVINGRIEERN